MVEQLRSERLSGIGEYYFSEKLREIDQLRNQGREIFNLGIGSPDLEPPQSVKQAILEGMREEGFHKYQAYKGLPELREAFCSWYRKFYHVSLNPNTEILPLIGSKEGIMHTCMALLNPGDEVLIPNPGYPTYKAAVKLAGGTPVLYSLKEPNGYRPDLTALLNRDLSKVKMMWVNYPHMPSGTKGDGHLFKQLIQFCRNQSIVLINDNPYSFTLTDSPLSVLENRRNGDWVLELNSLSKSHNMAGYRVGVLCGNAQLVDQVLTFKSNMDSGMFKPIMKASISALAEGNGWYEQQNKAYSVRKQLVHQIADRLDCTYSQNQVGMFVWARIPRAELNGKEFSDKLLKKYGLFVPPGMIFGSEGDQYIRFSLCSPTPLLTRVLERIAS